MCRQLIARGLLAVDLEGYGGLHLTEACRPVLRGEQPVLLRRDIKAPAAKKSRSDRTSHAFLTPRDQALWEALRTRRRELAAEQGVPPYVVFHDATLAELVERRPRTMNELAHISGIGERKLEAFGKTVLSVIGEHSESTV